MNKPISLTPAERLILVQQLDIIQKLYPEREEECIEKRTILQLEQTSEYGLLLFGEFTDEETAVTSALGTNGFQTSVKW
jgi:hypothetical protein